MFISNRSKRKVAEAVLGGIGLTLLLPPEEEIDSFLSHLWVFDKVAVTNEDARRTSMYKEDVARKQLEKGAVDIVDFVSSLKVKVDDDTYTVKEIRLLSTVFLDSDNALVQAPNTVLNGKYLINFRRSPEMSEPFTFDVAYDTSFEQIEALRGRMIAFLSNVRRDYFATSIYS